MTDFFSRLDMYMKLKGLNDNKVTVECSIANGIIGKARKRGSLSQENISKILYTYDDLDANWLLTGKGGMLKGQSAIKTEKCPFCIEKDKTIDIMKLTIDLLREKNDQLSSDLEDARDRSMNSKSA